MKRLIRAIALLLVLFMIAPVAIADDHDGQLGKERDCAAEGQLDRRELVEHDRQREHDRAFGKLLDG